MDDAWYGDGWSLDHRHRFFTMLAKKASLETLRRLGRFTHDLAPYVNDVEGRDARDAKYGPFPGPLFADDGDGRLVHPSDVTQGMLGDCYLLASLAAIADQRPELIEQMVHENPNGTYSVIFYQRGKPVEIVVTPDFPLEGGKPVFAQGGAAPEIWPLAIEKAYAQYKETYGSIEGGFPATALEQLTGIKSKEIKAHDISVAALEQYEAMHSAVALSTLSHKDPPLYRGNPPALQTNHAYYVTDVDPMHHTVTIHNPWGWEYPPLVLPISELAKNFDTLSVNALH
jgi:hypothetical protein